ncbi:bactofilin family protein [Parvibaculum lavamentivorans]|uniref:bactofilin family protein n=1 Tax=Parvibaculum lavamentivorans TaxID=256618 RepID=UPI0002FDFBA9|nr:polymer-forming cytoskeletal protein [Parvibaculum lavamentivorans]
MTLTNSNASTIAAPGLSPKGESRQPARADAPVRLLRAGNEDITIGENSILEGSFDTQGSMFVDGAAINADLRAAQLSIGATGRVEGQATVLRAEIAGTFDGTLMCSGEVILRSSSRISGELKCAKLVTHRGAVIAAEIHIVSDEEGGEEAIAGLSGFPPSWPTPFWSRRRIRKLLPYGYGAFLTLGAMGIWSFFA